MTERHYWQARLVKDGPFVAVLTWFGAPLKDGEELDRSPRWNALIRDETTSRAVLLGDSLPIEVEGIGLRNLEKVTAEQYHYLRAHGTWAVQHAPHHPAASPRKAINKRGRSVF